MWYIIADKYIPFSGVCLHTIHQITLFARIKYNHCFKWKYSEHVRISVEGYTCSSIKFVYLRIDMGIDPEVTSLRFGEYQRFKTGTKAFNFILIKCFI